PFDALLHEVVEAGAMTEYFLGAPTDCPQCGAQIYEKTLVDFDGEAKDGFDRIQCVDGRDEGQEIVFIGEATVIEARDLIVGWGQCSEEAELLFDQILDAVTGCDPSTTEYMILRPARCSFCFHEVSEKTLVVPR